MSSSKLASTATARQPQRITLHRRLGSVQGKRRRRILQAARQLAIKGGYDAVVMTEVAARAGVSLGTLYNYFSSKNHLLAEVMLEGATRMRERSPGVARASDSAADRLGGACRFLIQSAVEAHPLLSMACTRALVSGDVGSTDILERLASNMTSWVEKLLGDEGPADRSVMIRVLQHVCFSCMVEFASGMRPAESVGEEIERAVRLLLNNRNEASARPAAANAKS